MRTMNSEEKFRGSVQLAREVLGAVVEAAASDCKDVIEGRISASSGVRGASAAAFFLSPYGQGIVRDLVGEPGVRAGKRLATQALDVLDLTARAVAAVSPGDWHVAIDRSRMPRALTENSARPLRLVG